MTTVSVGLNQPTAIPAATTGKQPSIRRRAGCRCWGIVVPSWVNELHAIGPAADGGCQTVTGWRRRTGRLLGVVSSGAGEDTVERAQQWHAGRKKWPTGRKEKKREAPARPRWRLAGLWCAVVVLGESGKVLAAGRVTVIFAARRVSGGLCRGWSASAVVFAAEEWAMFPGGVGAEAGGRAVLGVACLCMNEVRHHRRLAR